MSTAGTIESANSIELVNFSIDIFTICFYNISGLCVSNGGERADLDDP